MKYHNITIGSLIKQKFDESKMTISEFAKKIHCSRSNIYNVFDAKSIDTDKLILISEVLDYSFLHEYIINSPATQTDVVINIEVIDGTYRVTQIKK